MKKDFILALNYKSNLVDIESFMKNYYFSLRTIIFPSFLQIEKMISYQKNNFYIGSQNVSKDSAVATGEIDAEMLKNYGVKYCIVGHSERREKLCEDNNLVNKKIKYLLKNEITPILCVGEKEIISDKLCLEFLKTQIDECVKDINENQSKIIIAYEPIFAIGTNKCCDNNHLLLVVNFIKQNYNFEKILYGGSVNEQNCSQLSKVDIDGFLIGKSSLSYEKMNEISKNLA